MPHAGKNDPRTSIPAPAGYVRFLLRRFASTPDLHAQLLQGTDIDDKRLQDPGAEVTLFTFVTLSENLCRVVGEDWPLKALPAWNTAMQGALEVAMRSAPTVGESLEILARFGHVRGPFLGLRLKREKAQTRLIVATAVAMSETAWRSLAMTVALGVAGVLDVVLEGATDELEFGFAWPPPDYADRLRAALPGKVKFAQGECAVCLPNQLCAQISPFADAALLATALTELEETSRRVLSQDMTVLKVERLLKRRRARRLSEEQAAEELGLSRRTLVRRLADNRTSFRALLDASLKQRARLLLDAGRLSRDEMAEALGFADPTSFSRACRRWFKRP
jgi:AraC-like DNA-binding protein